MPVFCGFPRLLPYNKNILIQLFYLYGVGVLYLEANTGIYLTEIIGFGLTYRSYNVSSADFSGFGAGMQIRF